MYVVLTPGMWLAWQIGRGLGIVFVAVVALALRLLFWVLTLAVRGGRWASEAGLQAYRARAAPREESPGEMGKVIVFPGQREDGA